MTDGRFYVGQEVVVRDVNERRSAGPRTGTVTKVGRKLVSVQVGNYQPEQYRIDTGSKNDRYGNGWIQTTSEYEDQQRRANLVKQLKERGIEIAWGSGRKHLVTTVVARVLPGVH